MIPVIHSFPFRISKISPEYQNPIYLAEYGTIADCRLAHRNLTDDELDRLVKQTFRIDQATLRELDGVSDHINTHLKTIP